MLDFACCAIRLAIELDGGQHDDAAPAGNRARDGGVLRFWNIEFEEHGDAVMAGILEAPESPMPSPSPLTEGEGVKESARRSHNRTEQFPPLWGEG
ncbi:DUF559 domain-containing protein [Klebsiella pneumoniae subsp. pneumoniae]|nr:DUF559 domain-containing protein [Klebsiella pneumoniae subsp. pneumoniae]